MPIDDTIQKYREVWNKIKYLIKQKKNDRDYDNTNYIRIKVN